MEGGGAASSSGGVDQEKNLVRVSAMMGGLQPTVGKGEHERPLLEGMLVAMRDLAMDTADRNGATYNPGRVPRNGIT